MALNVTITKTANVPEDYCFTTWDALIQKVADNIAGELAGSGTLPTFGKDTPDSSSRDRPWIRLNANGSLDRIYVFWNGLWVAPHQTPAAGSERRIWVGTTGALETYDGGASGDVTDVSGPFWEVDTAFEAKFPVGVGTFESTATVSVNGTGGAEQTTLLVGNLAAHAHIIAIEQEGSSGIEVPSEATGYFRGKGSETLQFVEGGSSTNSGNTREDGGNAEGEAEPFSNLPPYIGVYFIKRTARVYYTV